MASPASSSSAAGDDGVPSSAAASSIPHLPTSSAASRRLPPPCWSHEETLALIDAYRDKWYSLGRGNLRASHWDEVAAVVARCCPSSPVCKTSVQCRHKVEKLRKRYRSEKQRSLSSWLYFRKMDAMERGVAPTSPTGPTPRVLSVNGRAAVAAAAAAAAGGKTLSFTIPKAVRSKIVGSRPNEDRVGQTPGSRAAAKPVLGEMRRRVEEKRKRMREDEMVGGGVRDVAAALGMLGDDFLRIEQMKMEMTREMEKMRMEMELKRTEMILDCQRQIMDAMVQKFLGKKRVNSLQS